MVLKLEKQFSTLRKWMFFFFLFLIDNIDKLPPLQNLFANTVFLFLDSP